MFLSLGTGCLEGFVRLETAIRYDVKAQRFEVERRIEGVSATFFGCSDVDSCAEAITRAATLASTASDRSLADRLAQRITDSGAEEVAIVLSKNGDALDVTVRYGAPVGTKAAVDTYVSPEWTGSGDRGSYHLVVDAQESMGAAPSGVELRRTPVDANGTWKTQWVYSKRVRDVSWAMAVDPEPDPIFARMPGLAKRLRRAGLLAGRPEPTPATSPPVTVTESAPPVSTLPPAEPEQAPPSAVGGRMFTYDPRVTGTLTVEVATAAAERLEPGVRDCHQGRVKSGVAPEGYLFADARVRSDGWLLSYSVYGEVDDPEILRCVQGLMDGWEFGVWPGAEGAVAEVSIPYQFRRDAE